MFATYESSNQFRVPGDRTAEFLFGRRIKADCATQGIKYFTVLSSVFEETTTLVTVKENDVAYTLQSVLYGIVSTGASGSIPDHTHDGSEGSGGYISVSGTGGGVSTFLDLTDTPNVYDGGKYLYTTSSGIEFMDGIILNAPNDSKWMLKVTNSGTLYTEEYND